MCTVDKKCFVESNLQAARIILPKGRLLVWWWWVLGPRLVTF